MQGRHPSCRTWRRERCQESGCSVSSGFRVPSTRRFSAERSTLGLHGHFRATAPTRKPVVSHDSSTSAKVKLRSVALVARHSRFPCGSASQCSSRKAGVRPAGHPCPSRTLSAWEVAPPRGRVGGPLASDAILARWASRPVTRQLPLTPAPTPPHESRSSRMKRDSIRRSELHDFLRGRLTSGARWRGRSARSPARLGRPGAR